jgi:hypothetical protein
VSEDLVSVGSFMTDVEANFIRSQLEEAGVPAYVEGEAAAGLGPIAGSVTGARVLVARRDVRRALALLTDVPDEDEPPPPAAPASEAITDRPAPATAITAEPPDDEGEDEGPPRNAREEAADRALAAAIVGLVVCPVQLYVTWLLLKVFFSDEPLRDRLRWRPWVALAINLPALLTFALWALSTFSDSRGPWFD